MLYWFINQINNQEIVRLLRGGEGRQGTIVTVSWSYYSILPYYVRYITFYRLEKCVHACVYFPFFCPFVDSMPSLSSDVFSISFEGPY